MRHPPLWSKVSSKVSRKWNRRQQQEALQMINRRRQKNECPRFLKRINVIIGHDDLSWWHSTPFHRIQWILGGEKGGSTTRSGLPQCGFWTGDTPSNLQYILGDERENVVQEPCSTMERHGFQRLSIFIVEGRTAIHGWWHRLQATTTSVNTQHLDFVPSSTCGPLNSAVSQPEASSKALEQSAGLLLFLHLVDSAMDTSMLDWQESERCSC